MVRRAHRIPWVHHLKKKWLLHFSICTMRYPVKKTYKVQYEATKLDSYQHNDVDSAYYLVGYKSQCKYMYSGQSAIEIISLLHQQDIKRRVQNYNYHGARGVASFIIKLQTREIICQRRHKCRSLFAPMSHSTGFSLL